MIGEEDSTGANQAPPPVWSTREEIAGLEMEIMEKKRLFGVWSEGRVGRHIKDFLDSAICREDKVR